MRVLPYSIHVLESTLPILNIGNLVFFVFYNEKSFLGRERNGYFQVYDAKDAPNICYSSNNVVGLYSSVGALGQMLIGTP